MKNAWIWVLQSLLAIGITAGAEDIVSDPIADFAAMATDYSSACDYEWPEPPTDILVIRFDLNADGQNDVLCAPDLLCTKQGQLWHIYLKERSGYRKFNSRIEFFADSCWNGSEDNSCKDKLITMGNSGGGTTSMARSYIIDNELKDEHLWTSVYKLDEVDHRQEAKIAFAKYTGKPIDVECVSIDKYWDNTSGGVGLKVSEPASRQQTGSDSSSGK